MSKPLRNFLFDLGIGIASALLAVLFVYLTRPTFLKRAAAYDRETPRQVAGRD